MADVTTILVALLGSAVVSALVSHFGEQARAREERRQTRLAAAYIEVIETTVRMETWANRALKFVSRPTDPPLPAMPTEEQQLKLIVLISAYGSVQMQNALKSVASAQRAFVDALERRDELLQRPPEAPTKEENHAATFGAVEEVRSGRLGPAVRTLLALANDELAERHASWWTRHQPHWPRKAPMSRR